MLVPILGGRVDLTARRIHRDGEEAPLTSLEARLLAYLAERAGQIVPETALLTDVWGQARAGDTRAVAHAVYRLRKKIERDPGSPRHLYTEHGCGYRWMGVEDAPAPSPVGEAPRPPAPTGMVGRGEELSTIERALAGGARGVLLLGGGGVGKTTLARATLAAARARGTAGIFVDAAAARDEGDLVAAFATALGTRAPALDVGHALAGTFGEAGGLVVVDNVEQVLAAAERVCARLWAGAPAVRLLVTSRSPLSLPGLSPLVLAPLPVPEAPDASAPALALFLRVARETVPGFAPDAAGLRLARDCVDLVGGLPLAIELAAARLRVFPLRELVARLGASTVALSDPSPLRPARHRSVTATLDWSWGLLEPAERAAFAVLSVFAGRFTAGDAEAVLGPDGVDQLDALVRAGLVEPAGEEGARMLPPVRRYAASRLAEDPARAAAARAAHRAQVIERTIASLDDPDALARWRGDLDLAIDDALAQGDLLGATRCFHPLATDLTSRGPHSRLGALVGALWRHPQATPTTRAWLLGGPLEDVGVLTEIPRHEIDAAVATVPPGSVEADLATAASAQIRLAAGDDRVSLPDLLELAERLRRAGKGRAAVRSIANVGVEQRRRGEHVAAAGTLTRVAALADGLGLGREAAMARANLSGVLSALGRYDDAIDVAGRARVWGAQIGDRRREALAVGNIGFALTRAGRVEEGLARFQEAAAIAALSGDPSVEANSLLNWGENLRRLGNLGEALVTLRRCRDTFDRLGTRRGRVVSRITLAQCLLDLGDAPAAGVTLDELHLADPTIARDPSFEPFVRGLGALVTGDLSAALEAAAACPDPDLGMDLVVRAARDAAARRDQDRLDAAGRVRDLLVERRPSAAAVIGDRWPGGS